MFRMEDGKDLTDKEFEDITYPHQLQTELFLEEYIIPEYVAFYIASGYYESAIWEGSFDILINSSADVFNYIINDKNKLKKAIIKLLRSKYSLNVISEKPTLKIEVIPLSKYIYKKIKSHT